MMSEGFESRFFFLVWNVNEKFWEEYIASKDDLGIVFQQIRSHVFKFCGMILR